MQLEHYLQLFKSRVGDLRKLRFCASDADVHNRKGVALLNKGAFASAIQEFNHALELDSKDFQAMDYRGRASFSLVKERFADNLIPDSQAALPSLVRTHRITPQADRYLYCPQYRFLYAPIPKASCSSFKMLLYLIFKRDIPELPEFSIEQTGRNFHLYINKSFSLCRYKTKDAQAILASEKIFKFTTVRNPFDRIASAYLDKFVTNRLNEEQYEHTLPVLRAVFGKRADPQVNSLSFRQFVRYLFEHDNLNNHWTPISKLVDPARMDMVLRTETIKADYEKLRERLQIPLDLPHTNRTPRGFLNATRGAYADTGTKELASLPSLPTTAQLYDKKLEQSIRHRYADDFAVFHYSDRLNVD